MTSTVDELHEALFGFRPAKAGAAYERLAALVFATLGWEHVRHDTRERPEGKRALHQLDVTARRPDGQVKRLLVECKNWDETVGKSTLDTLVGVRNQIRADAGAVVTTKGFTQGAIDVAIDEDIALIRMKPFNPEDSPKFVRSIVLTITAWAPVYENWDIEVMPNGRRSGRFGGEVHRGRSMAIPVQQR